MEYMFAAGFLGTQAPWFMDSVTLIVALLPLLVYGVILIARRGYYRLHALLQNFLFVVSVLVVGYFEYGVRSGGGFDAFMSGSSVDYNYAFVVLVVHIIIATLTLLHWIKLVVLANITMRCGTLPGSASRDHKVLARKTFTGITFTSLSGIWVYLLLFVY